MSGDDNWFTLPKGIVNTDDDEKTEVISEPDRLREFFFGKPKEYTWVEKQRKDAGLCPQCGEEGRIHLSVMICSVHGEY